MSEPKPTPHQWCEDLQVRLMAALDAAWALAEGTDDPAVLIRATARAKLCGQIAAQARKVAALTPPPARADAKTAQPSAKAAAVTDLIALTTALETAVAARDAPVAAQAQITRTALERLKAAGGRRGRL